MRNRFDQLGKQLGQAALGLSGPTVLQDEIPSEVRYADLRHEPAPARTSARARLGLLGRLASGLCLIELYGHAPNGAELRACLGKHIAFWQRHARRARRRKQAPRTAPVEPFLWIVTAGTPEMLLAKLKLEPAPGWPPGVYWFGADVLRVGLVVASKLPRDRSTVLVRLMAAGPLLPRAITELSKLPANAPERVLAGPILVRFQHALEKKPSRTSSEQEFLVAIDIFEKARREAQKQGRKEGQTQARAEAQARAVLTVLRARGVRVSSSGRKRILAERDPERLERWLERASVEASLAAVLREPS